jgi:predicted aspartyl protease
MLAPMKIALALVLLSSVSAAQDMAPPPVQPGEVIDLAEDRFDRFTVPVRIGSVGPYAFVVDTGAERTAIAQELARELGLAPGQRARLHSMSEVSDVETVIIPMLVVGGKKVAGINAPSLQRRNIGAEGVLGVDSLQSQRVSFDFVKQSMTVYPSRRREESWPADTIVITARNRYGRLVLVDASVEGEKVWVILDTGAQNTVGNNALRKKLELKGKVRRAVPIEMTSVTGGKIRADQTWARNIRLGGVNIRDMPVAFADVHPFKKLGLTDRPALLLGMDALRLFERISVDFANRKVRLLPPARSEIRIPTMTAGRATRPFS